jgi:transposase
MLMIGDGWPAHRRSRKVKAFRSETDGRVHLEQLPGDAPDLNPDEGIWQYLKNVELKNVCCENIETVRKPLRRAFERLCHQTEVLIGGFGWAGLELPMHAAQ